jgi:hypothetical protein
MMKFLASTLLAGLMAAGVAAAGQPPPRINYFFVNANQPAVLDREQQRLSFGAETMGIEDCSGPNLSCFSIPFLSIMVAVANTGLAEGEWRVGDRIFCVRQKMTVSAQDTVYSVVSSRSGGSCETQVRESSFLFSSKRGVLSFSKVTADGGGMVFTLVDAEGFGAK